jgi:hypothetical protein
MSNFSDLFLDRSSAAFYGPFLAEGIRAGHAKSGVCTTISGAHRG